MFSTFSRILIYSFLFCSSVFSQDYRYEIGIVSGTVFYLGDANRKTLFKESRFSSGLMGRYNINTRWGIKGECLWGCISGNTRKERNVFPDNGQVSFRRRLLTVSNQVEFNFLPNDFSPYIGMGIGFTVLPGIDRRKTFLQIPVEIGVKYKWNKRIHIGCEFSFRKLFCDDLDVVDENSSFLKDPYQIKSHLFKNKDGYSFLLLSVTWNCIPVNTKCRKIFLR